jgi:hypothetical protein
MDLTGNMDRSVDEVAVTPPSPDFMEGTNIWMWDDEGRIHLPRVAVDAMGSMWDERHMVSVNVATEDGRVLVVRGFAPPISALDSQGRPRVRGTETLKFECLEPFSRWRMTFDGLAGETTTAKQIENRFGGPGSIPEQNVPLKFEIEQTLTVAPWVNGAYEYEGTILPTEHRIEQLGTVEGQVELDGTTIPFKGSGLRIHRKGTMGRSDYSTWQGHVWLSAQFPSGRALGLNQFHPFADGTVRYHEGFIYDGDELLPAKFVEAPWKTDWVASGEDVSFTLRTKRGDVDITATTVATTCNPIAPPPDGRKAFPSTQQGIVRYRWGNEEAYGMIERSSPLEEGPT